MKLIFLDIDGVLNSESFRPEDPEGLVDWLDERNVRVLGRLISTTGARIVVTSSWRLTTSLPDIEAALAERGATISLAGTTPSLGPRCGRRRFGSGSPNRMSLSSPGLHWTMTGLTWANVSTGSPACQG